MGRSLVNIALERGDYVIATARKLDSIRDYTVKCVTHYLLSPLAAYLNLTARSPETADRVHIMTLDVTAPFSELREKAGEAVAKWGRVDCLINNAGAGMPGLIEEVG